MSPGSHSSFCLKISKREGEEDGSRVGGPQARLVPRPQLDNYRITLNTPEIDPKIIGTNSITKGTEDATSKKIFAHPCS